MWSTPTFVRMRRLAVNCPSDVPCASTRSAAKWETFLLHKNYSSGNWINHRFHWVYGIILLYLLKTLNEQEMLETIGKRTVISNQGLCSGHSYRILLLYDNYFIHSTSLGSCRERKQFYGTCYLLYGTHVTMGTSIPTHTNFNIPEAALFLRVTPGSLLYQSTGDSSQTLLWAPVIVAHCTRAQVIAAYCTSDRGHLY